ncbi:MAG: fimbrillin family protein [Prevotella sp.]|nr:fimbrillin family protein [Prevotella sp.]
MKKMLFGLMSLAAVAALTSCSNEDTVAQQKSAAALENELRIFPMVNANMRAITEYSTSTINADNQQFRMIATGNFSVLADGTADPTLEQVQNATDKVTAFDDILTYTGGAWNLSTAVVPTGSSIYWADKTTKAIFKAVAPKDVKEGENTISGGVTTENYASASDCRDNMKDIIVAYNEGTKKDFTNGVPINFRHVLSRVQFKAVNKDQSSGMVLEVKAIKLGNIASKASLTYPTIVTGDGFAWEKYSPWANSSTAQYYYGSNNSAISIQSVATGMSDGQDFYLLPQQLVAADGEALKAGDKTKQYVSFLIRVYYVGTYDALNPNTSSVSTAVYNASNTSYDASKKNIWPFAKVATAFDTTVDEDHPTSKHIGAGYLDKTSYASLSDADKANATLCSDASEFAWAAVPIDTNWEPGKKYVYTLNYSAAGLGMTDPEDSAVPGEDIIPESPVKLWFTVTVSDWEEVPQNQNI